MGMQCGPSDGSMEQALDKAMVQGVGGSKQFIALIDLTKT